MKRERIILAYKNYFKDFISSLSDAEARKVNSAPNMVATSSACSSSSMMATSWCCSTVSRKRHRRLRKKK